jgi:hemoglobin/transferrin/lactoferrin receptor protein
MSKRVAAGVSAGVVFLVFFVSGVVEAQQTPPAADKSVTEPESATPPPLEAAPSIVLPKVEVSTSGKKKKSAKAKQKSAPAASAGSGVDTTIPVTPLAADADVPPTELPYVTPGSSAYISRQDIEQFPGTSPADIFKSTAGVLVGEARNSGAIDVNIRGLQGYGRTSVTIDGAQQQSNVDRGYFGDANRTFIDPDLLSGISITKGPSNDPSSSGAIGGTVAMTTLTAEDVVKPGQTWGVRIRGGGNTNSSEPPPAGTVGGIENVGRSIIVSANVPGQIPQAIPASFGDTLATGRPGWFDLTGRNGSFAMATKQQNFSIVGALTYRENGNYHAGTNGDYARIGEQFRSNTNYFASAGNINTWNTRFPGHGFQIGDAMFINRIGFGNIGITDYRAGEEVFNTSYQSSSALLKGTFALDDENKLELGYMRNKSQFGFIWPSAYKFLTRPEQTPLSDAMVDTLTARYRYNPVSTDLINVSLNTWFTRQQFDEVQTYSFNSYSNFIDSDALMGGFDLSNTSKLGDGLTDVSLLYGVAYLSENAKLSNDTVWKAGVGDSTSNSDSQRKQWDAFTTAIWKPTSWFTAEAGMRYVTVTNGAEYGTVYKANAPPPSQTLQKERTVDGAVPNAALTLEPIKGLQFYGSYKEGLRIPSFIENRDIGFNSSIVDLRPEHAHTSEAGINLLAGGVLTSNDTLGIKANYFLNSIDDYIMMEYAYQSFILTTMNYDRALFSGVELAGMYDAGFFFGSASAIYYDRVKLCKTPALCYSAEDAAGIPLNDWRNQLPPGYSATAMLGVRLFDEKLSLAARVNYTGERAGMPEVYFNSTSPYWQRYTTYDAFVSYRFEDDFTLEFSGENITDIYYVDALATAMQPAPGRTLRVNLTKQF